MMVNLLQSSQKPIFGPVLAKYHKTRNLYNMQLSDLELTPKRQAIKTLKENFGTSFNTSKLSLNICQKMLGKVSGLIKEAKSKPSYHLSHNDPSYLKLVVMEQALWDRYAQLGGRRKTEVIITEAENVAQAQTMLAAKDLVDSIQKMIQASSDLLVKSLPVVTDAVRSQIGANESREFNDEATDILRGLVDALMDAKSKMQTANDKLAGEDVPDAFTEEPDADDEQPVEEPAEESSDDEVPTEAEGELDAASNVEDSSEEPAEIDMAPSEDELAAGREKQ